MEEQDYTPSLFKGLSKDTLKIILNKMMSSDLMEASRSVDRINDMLDIYHIEDIRGMLSEVSNKLKEGSNIDEHKCKHEAVYELCDYHKGFSEYYCIACNEKVSYDEAMSRKIVDHNSYLNTCVINSGNLRVRKYLYEKVK